MSASDIANRMYYWCAKADLGYDQDNRWDIRDGGETDCSALYLYCLWEVGYLPERPTWGNTDSLRSQLEPLGFKFLVADNSKTAPSGVGLLRNRHIAVSMGNGNVAQASIDERGKTSGGQTGDQTGLETKVSKDPKNWLWWIYPPDASTSSSMNTSTGGEKVYYFGHVQRGTTGTSVKMLQSALNIRVNSGLAIDGSCGPATTQAITNWQSSHGLTVDGSCGPATWTSVLSE